MKYEKYYWLNEDSRLFLSRGYLDDETPEKRFRDIANNAEKILGITGFADKFEDYLSRGYYSLSTPVICNYGKEKGLPVSCFNSYIPDTMEGILDKVSEVGIMSKAGGGTSGYFGDLRPRGTSISSGGDSSGPVHFMELFDKVASVVSQGKSRRGSFAAYLDVDHPDIKEFLQIRELDHAIQEMSIGVNISDAWMESMIAGDSEKRAIWAEIIKKRYSSGYPYIHFIDNVNNQAPDVYKEFGMKIKSSNLCSEISLYQDKDNSFVCVLASINLLHWDEIKDTDAVETLIYFLDTVNEEFVTKTKDMKHMESARNFAINQRALGMGVLGWHSYLQSKMIPFESILAKGLNNSIFKALKERVNKASIELASFLGEPPLLKGKGRRNTTLMAIAPTTSSSFILGQVSPSIEPLKDNYFTKDLAKGVFGFRNTFLQELLISKDKNTNIVWDSILNNGGSVQHLDFLSQEEKDVFKTFGEISQKEIIIQAAQRQHYIDQSQSLNIWVHPKTPPKEVSDLMIYAWRNGIKSLYYQRSLNPTKHLLRSLNECKSCEA